MADYWKSLPRKFCEFCKCWITDNKPSVEFHERGKRHKENVEQKINEVRKKGQKAWEQEKSMMKDIEAMEQAALKAYEKDLKDNPSLIREVMPALHSVSTPKEVSSSSRQSSSAPVQFKAKRKKKFTSDVIAVAKDSVPSKPIIKEWCEGLSDEGYTYYWNTSTGESKWDVPEEGFISLNEQKSYQNAVELSADEIVDNKIEDEEPNLEKSDNPETSVSEIEDQVEKSIKGEDANEEICDIKKSSKENSDEEESNDKSNEESNEYDKSNEESNEYDKSNEESNDKPNEEKSNNAEISVDKVEVPIVSKEYSSFEENTKSKTKSPEVFVKRKSVYGDWVTVTTETPVDLELPDRGTVEINVPCISDNEPKFKFKEKTISKQSDEYCAPIAFKKRKLDGQKKNMRKRDTENSL